MRLPYDVIIPREKLTNYLLIPRRKNDKSGFLAQAGFDLENAVVLEKAIRALISENDAILDGENEYGTFYRVEGALRGPKAGLLTITIWLQQVDSDTFRFITLKPLRKR